MKDLLQDNKTINTQSQRLHLEMRKKEYKFTTKIGQFFEKLSLIKN
jgi:hypothetical protein